MTLPGYDNITLSEPDTFEHKSSIHGCRLSLGVKNLSCLRNDRVLFSGLDFIAQEGQLLQIEGENGSGKTSLLKTLCGFIEPELGEVQWRGVNIKQAMDTYLADLHYVGHSNGIKLGLSCRENLRIASALALTIQTMDITSVLERYGLGQYEDTLAQLLSSGQRRRLALARLSVCRAQIWILDEPFTSLDEKAKGLVKGIFRSHLESGGLIIMTSHEELNWDGANMLKISL